MVGRDAPHAAPRSSNPRKDTPVSQEPRLVHIVDDVPGLEAATEPGQGRNLTMVLVLDGFLDAGNAAARAAQHLVDLGEGPVVATFDVDQFHDYRARRPAMSFVRDHYEAYDAPRLVVRLLHDTGGTPYLLLQGPEPDNRWEAFARAVREVVERFGVTRVVSMGSVPMAVPHTRPIAVTHHANDPDLLIGESAWRGELRIPSSAQALLEVRLGEWGHAAMGFVAHIPHYLAQLDYPKASAALLEQVEKAGRLTVDLSDLLVEAEEREVEIARYLAANDEVNEVVVALEQQYDAFERAEESGSSLLAEDQPLPTGEEIGQQFEQFLAGLDGPDEQS
ncbi:PAC2 family protein [Nocardioides ungokensis]